MDDRFALERFVQAQDSGGTFGHALSELRHGRKTSHWMWFVFPQIAGLGNSSMSRTYAIASLDEAQAYLLHPVLGPRLTECCTTLLRLKAHSAAEGQSSDRHSSGGSGDGGSANDRALDVVSIFGGIDAQKLQSSMTLFLRAAPQQPVFAEVLHRYFDSIPDAATDRLLEGTSRRESERH
jgi:uncharacterized protein (DUF1810 family)